MIKDLELNFIKHNTFKDICFQVEDCFFTKNGIEINGSWLNQGFTESWYLNERQTINISKDDYKNWLICNELKDKCLRYCKWESILL